MTTMSGETAKDPGDDKCIVRAYLNWADSTKTALTLPLDGPAACHVQNEGGRWQLAFSILRGERRQHHFAYVSSAHAHVPDTWPMVKLAEGVWDIPVSIHIQGQIHGFFTLVNVPAPAPWEL